MLRWQTGFWQKAHNERAPLDSFFSWRGAPGKTVFDSDQVLDLSIDARANPIDCLDILNLLERAVCAAIVYDALG